MERRRDPETQGRRPCDNRDTDWRDVSTRQGPPVTDSDTTS